MANRLQARSSPALVKRSRPSAAAFRGSARSWYGSAIAYEMCEKHKGKGWLILDQGLYRQAWRNVLRDKSLPFQRDPVVLALLFQRKKAQTLDAPAAQMGFDPTTFSNRCGPTTPPARDAGTTRSARTQPISRSWAKAHTTRSMPPSRAASSR